MVILMDTAEMRMAMKTVAEAATEEIAMEMMAIEETEDLVAVEEVVITIRSTFLIFMILSFLGRGGGRGGGGGGFNRDGDRENNDGGFNNNQEDGGGGEDGEEPRKKVELYIPPEPTENEEEMFASGISSGINFEKYEKIPVKVSGENVPKPITDFETSGLRSLILENVKKSGYTVPTPIQKNSIPVIKEKRDLMACAQTGSGKTVSFS